MDHLFRYGFFFCAAFFLISGCRETPSNDEASSPKKTVFVSQGIITAVTTRFLDSSSEEPFEQFELTAMFPRYAWKEQFAAETLLKSHVPQSDLSVDSCGRPEPVLRVRNPRLLSEKTEVKLMDVGDMRIDYMDQSLAIPTRTFPDLLKIIDGVIYTLDNRRNLEFLADETYILRADGGDQVAPLEVVLDAPNDLGDVRLNGISPSDRAPVISTGRPAVLTWEGTGYGDEVIIAFTWTNVGLSWSATCRMKDDGHFTIPADITAEMTSDIFETGHEVSISRVRQVSFRSRGLTYGDFSFVATTNFLIRFAVDN